MILTEEVLNRALENIGVRPQYAWHQLFTSVWSTPFTGRFDGMNQVIYVCLLCDWHTQSGHKGSSRMNHAIKQHLRDKHKVQGIK